MEVLNEKMATLNKKISQNIPDDLALNILSKLPVKSLKRFQCVRKSWADLLEDPHFKSMYYENFISKMKNNDSRLLLKQQMPSTSQENLFLLSGERYENKVKLDWPPPFQENSNGLCIFGSCVNGIICLNQVERNVVLWNPTTEEFKVIPLGLVVVPGLDFSMRYYGFGYDQMTDDYKLVRQVHFFLDTFDSPEELPSLPEPVWFWQIYSLKSDCWRKLDLEMLDVEIQPVGFAIYLNGVCHFWGVVGPFQGTEEVEDLLVSFDLSNERFHTTLIDRHCCYEFVNRYLVVFNGSIATISMVSQDKCFVISILGEVGVKESWVNLFSIGPLPCVEHPIGVGNKGDIFFRKNDDELAWFDLSTQMIKEIGIKGAGLCQTVTYKESFLFIGGIN